MGLLKRIYALGQGLVRKVVRSATDAVDPSDGPLEGPAETEVPAETEGPAETAAPSSTETPKTVESGDDPTATIQMTERDGSKRSL